MNDLNELTMTSLLVMYHDMELYYHYGNPINYDRNELIRIIGCEI